MNTLTLKSTKTVIYKGKFNFFCKRGHLMEEHGHGKSCRVCRSKRDREWYSKNKELAKKRRIDYELRTGRTKNAYWAKNRIANHDGSCFTLQDYNRAFQIQGGMCKACHQHQSELKKSLHVDHDHSTGFFRGLLCNNCNRVLGLCKEKKEVFENLINYLDKSKELSREK